MYFKEFIAFVREQGVVGLAVGFILGGSTQKVVSALVNDIISPVIGLLLPHAESLAEKKFTAGAAEILWGDFLKVLIDFLIVTAVVYYGVKVLHATQFDRKKQEP
ncbi:MAG: large conductance mechanosensitive channel protein MscL [Candidatus Andersenbacteria bacterium CG10_big_fil_rev_8_21_14_0_10_54_11]|uniref:Large conductance mechanosensitive channel protein MscL n=1 Tax=Candidatus Andersenbacteria bacterium CG10_big_fil_rev_8_21_14_0_10_54_11 TaxID=1974485 RepID=A0A2M6WZU3_9BACT|nr:MAG: large conductance mechanosensitive channel protein MscL [Candidatus Andersenbacteria bacterium CG10_big_fil_rev_8_21_14_0_10_54_11]